MDRRRIEEELRTQNRRFEVTLAHMEHGLCMVDREQRIVVCNARYAEMYDLPAHLAKPGKPIADIFAHRVAKGLQAASEDEEYNSESALLTREPTEKTRHLRDGRVVLISRRPTGDGGWIATHQDVTERQRLVVLLEERNLLLQQREAELQEQNSNLDTALANMLLRAWRCSTARNGWCSPMIAMQKKPHGLEPQHLQPGTTLRELVEYRIAKGLYPGAQRMTSCATCASASPVSEQTT